MYGTVYYVPTNKKSTGVLVVPKNQSQMSTNAPVYQEESSGMFPQTGNSKGGIFAQILGVLIGVLTLIGIDIKKQRN